MRKKYIIFAPMISIDIHISQLISRHECVIVPGFGAFLSHRVPARYNAEEQVYMPPTRTLVFNSRITMDDALLTTAYMEQYGISYNQASILMRDDVRKLKNRLSRKGKIYFGELGVLSMNLDGTISFEASENGIDDPANYGMMPLPMAMLSQKEEKAITIPISRKKIAQYVAAAAAIIIMFVFVTPLGDRTFRNGIKASLGSFASPGQISMMQQVTSPAPAVIHNNVCEICPIEESATPKHTAEATDVVIENQQSAETEPLQIPVQAEDVAPQPVHHIIVASSPNAENAQLAIKELSTKATYGYSVVEGNRRFRISAGSYPTIQDAQAALSSVQATFPDAWILTR